METILNSVKKWSKASGLKKLKTPAGVGEFYNDIQFTGNLKNVKFITPFFQHTIAEAFDPAKVSIKEFRPFINGISKLLYTLDINENMNTFLKAKGIIKKHMMKYHKTAMDNKDHSNKFVKSWYNSNLYILPEEFKVKNTNADAKVAIKNNDVLNIPLNKVEKFYSLFIDSEDLIDAMLTVQATLGLRLIEVLSSKVSNFEIVDKNIMQIGSAKTNVNIEKNPVMISPKQWMDKLKIVRDETDKFKDLNNIKLREKYNVLVNDRIQKYLRMAGIQEHNELKSSHGLRRLYVNLLYSMREEPNLTLHAFIKKYLGHTSDNATNNYNSINITTDAEIEEPTELIAGNSFIIEPKKTKTQIKFDKITKALSEGKSTYSQMSDIGITNQMYSNYKKLHN
jgi:integrase